MNAGRELDALVAEKVMGWTDFVRKTPTCWPQFDVTATPPDWGGARYHRVPDYSTDIAAAWGVVEKMEARHHWVIKSPFLPERGDTWFVGISGWNGRPDWGANADTAPLAICLAALKAKGVEVMA